MYVDVWEGARGAKLNDKQPQDIYSYNVEQVQGEKVNIIAVSMKERNIGVQAAMDYAGELVHDCIRRYQEAKTHLPSWGPAVDSAVLGYCSVMEAWCSGGFHWVRPPCFPCFLMTRLTAIQSLTSERYFGKDVAEVRKTLTIELYGAADEKQDSNAAATDSLSFFIHPDVTKSISDLISLTSSTHFTTMLNRLYHTLVGY